LLTRLILECYQTFNSKRQGLNRTVYDTEACRIGKLINRRAESEKPALHATGFAFGKGGWTEDAAWKS
jgi:hypothetical protein